MGLFGDRVHVVTDDAPRTSQRVLELLAESGITPLGIRAIEPSLEDVFVSVLGEIEEREAAAGTEGSGPRTGRRMTNERSHG